ncbi:protein of unknown function (plasmid) [Latilactobacillus sakei]|nr:protein of unknown function [Latilactobacillus sakei]
MSQKPAHIKLQSHSALRLTLFVA